MYKMFIYFLVPPKQKNRNRGGHLHSEVNRQLKLSYMPRKEALEYVLDDRRKPISVS